MEEEAMSENKPWWKRFALWIFAGVAAIVLFALTGGRKAAPVIIPIPPKPDLDPVPLPDVNPTPHKTYLETKVTADPQPSKRAVANIMARLKREDKKG